jgi:hypothetical protein
MKERTKALADRLEQGSRALADFAGSLTDEEWNTPIPHDGRTVGVVVHHVASVYPVEIDLAKTIAGGAPVIGVTSGVIDDMNAGHARQNRDVTKDEALALLQRNSAAAAEAIRDLTDDDLDRAATVSLYSDAPLTCQFVLEDHAVRHSYHHFALIRAALRRELVAAA